MLLVVAIPDVMDGPLALTRRRLDTAVHALTDPVPVWDHGTCHWTAPLYSRLRGALRASRSNRGRATPGQRPPCRVDVLNLLVEIDTAVASWECGKGGTVDRLHRLAGHRYRPQDCDAIDGMCNELERWTIAVVALLGDSQPAVALRLPCPSCGARYAYRRNNVAETVRTDALRVSEDGCACSACHAVWTPGEFHFLARLLGCEALPTA